MRLFFDSSAFVKRFVAEKGSDEVETLCLNASVIALSSIFFPEIISAMNRRLREKSITRKDYRLIKNKLIGEIEDIEIINIVPEVISKSVSLLEKNNLRTLDALHIASAFAWECDLFVSADKRQLMAAKKSGLKVKLID